MIAAALLGLLFGNFALTALGGLFFLIGLVLVAPALVKPIASALSVLVAFAIARQGTGELAQGNLTRQPSRSAITASATMIGLAIVVAAGGMLWTMNTSVKSMFLQSMRSEYMLVPPSLALWKGNVGATQSLGNKIRSVQGVEAVGTLRFAQSEIPTKDAGDMATSLLGIDPVVFPQVSGMDFQKGNAQQAYVELAQGRTIIVNGILAAQAGINIGDNVALSSPQGQQDYRVVAIAGDVLNMKINTAYISQANMRADFNKTEDIFYQVNLKPDADPVAVDQRLKTIVEDYPQFKLVATRQNVDEFMEQYESIYAAMYLLLVVLSIPSLIAILNTLAIGVIERTREIGMLRAIGATRGQVRRMVVAEALLLSAIGTAFGIIAGLYLSYVLVQGVSASGLVKMEYSFPYVAILAAIAVGLIFGVIAALVPARQAARLQIIQALRYE
jgi:putative ABC transport system permease protein